LDRIKAEVRFLLETLESAFANLKSNPGT